MTDLQVAPVLVELANVLTDVEALAVPGARHEISAGPASSGPGPPRRPDRRAAGRSAREDRGGRRRGHRDRRLGPPRSGAVGAVDGAARVVHPRGRERNCCVAPGFSNREDSGRFGDRRRGLLEPHHSRVAGQGSRASRRAATSLPQGSRVRRGAGQGSDGPRHHPSQDGTVVARSGRGGSGPGGIAAQDLAVTRGGSAYASAPGSLTTVTSRSAGRPG